MQIENGPTYFGDTGMRVPFSGNIGLGLFDRPITISGPVKRAA